MLSDKLEEIFYKSRDEQIAIQNEGIRRMMSLCEKGHPYYKKSFDEEGIDFSSIRTIEDLETLPLTSKKGLHVST